MSPVDSIDEAAVDAIGALGNRTRLEILFALVKREEACLEQWTTMSFTELYDAVDLESTSQFSYHLDRLVDEFVVETPDGYRLTYGGDKLVRTILSGAYESTPSFNDLEVDGACVFCEDSALVATMDTERFVVRCRTCEATLLNDMLPRSQTRHRSRTAIVDSVGTRIWSTQTLVRDGVCPECYGPVDTAVVTNEPDAGEYDRQPFYALSHTCQECWLAIHMPIEVTAAFHPAAVGFFWMHGISLLECPLWEFFEYMVDGTVSTQVDSDDPLEATVEITFEDETLRLGIDDSLTVVSESIDRN